jgi:L-arabinonolactonase
VSNAAVGTLLTSIKSQNILGENVLWHDAEQAVYWIDIEAALLQRYCLAKAEYRVFALPQRIGSFAFLQDGPQLDFQLIAAFAEGFALYNFHSKALKWLSQPEGHLAGHRFNDGRVNRQGEFWAGTMVENATLSDTPAALYRLDATGKAQPMLGNMCISNGLCWSLDGRILYHADSPKHQINQYPYDAATGTVGAGVLFADTPHNAHPDGSTIDAVGYLWNAHWGAGKVVRYRPDGSIDLELNLPVSQPSSVAIGGPSLDLLFVTSSKLGLSEEQLAAQPLAGNLFIYQLHGIQGVLENHCQLSAEWLL